ncbi:MAG: type II CAAX endopeptidase family protein, partial [Planctomycetota bacterium]
AGVMSVVPLINIVLLTREVLSGTAMFFPAVMAVVSTIAYAAAALSIASSLFGTDAVDRTSQQSIGAFLRRPEVSSRVPSPALAALVMAVLVPIYFVVSNGLLRYLTNVKTAVLDGADDLSLDQAVSLQIQSMTLSAISLILVFGGVPLLASWFGKLELRTTFRLNRVKLGAILGAAIVGLGAWVFAHEAFVIADALGIGGVSESVLEKTKKVLEAWTRVPPWVLLATLALTPAVIEELCFRGFLFSAIGSVTTGNRTILITALLFGFFHVVTGNALLIERFIPSFLLGLLLGWIAHRTSSVIPGMALHFVHNGLLELLGHYHERLAWLGDTYATDAHLPIVWLGGATLIIAVGITLLVVSSRRAVSVETSDAA